MHLRRPATWWRGVFPTAVLPLAVAVVTLVGTRFAAMGQPDTRELDLVATTLLLVGPVALVLRYWHPPAVFGTVVVALVGYLGLGYPYGPVFLAALVALVTTVAAGHRVPAYTITALGLATSLMIFVVQHPEVGFPLVGAGAWLAWLAAVIAAAELWRARRDRRVQAEVAQAEAALRRGSEERLRIARDLHDVLGHHVSLINVQAGVALYLMDEDPEQARSALTAIKQSSRDLLREMRSTLGVLRGVDEEPPQHPVAGLAGLDALVAATRDAGVSVTVEVAGQERALPPTVDAAAYRIVQEALTNVRRHAHAASATVFLDYTPDGLDVRVDDDGVGSNGAGSGSDGSGGNGLPGMRERAAALGGSLTAAAQPGGGFRVAAHLPTTGDS